MQVFFVMAGYTSLGTKRTILEQIAIKSKRLLIPYAFYGIVLILLGAMLPSHTDIGKALLGLLYGRYSVFDPAIENHIPLLQACGYLSPFWFLPCIFLSYVLLAWYDHSRYPFIVVLLALIMGCLTPFLPILLPWSIEMAFVGFLLMLCGRAMREQQLLERSDQPLIKITITIVCVAIYLMCWYIDGPVNMSLSDMGNGHIPSVFKVLFFVLLGISEALCFSICFREWKESWVTRCFSYIGRNAVRLLCIHLFIGQSVYFVLDTFHLPMAVNFTCALMLLLIIDYIIQKLHSYGKALISNPS